MPTTSPSNIWYPDGSGLYNYVADLGALAESIQRALDNQANAFSGLDSDRIAYTTEARNGALWSNTDGDKKVYQFRNGRWYPDYEFLPLDRNSQTNGNFVADENQPPGVHVSGFGRMATLQGAYVQKSIFDWDTNSTWQLGIMPERVRPKSNLNTLVSAWTPDGSLGVNGLLVPMGIEARSTGLVRFVPHERFKNTKDSTSARLEIPGISWIISTA